ncbi:MAG TPA: hypothetical protein PLQ15_01500 [Syntrophales bacterium]|nr:hypothetical protein [Syntrophales bacterium]
MESIRKAAHRMIDILRLKGSPVGALLQGSTAGYCRPPASIRRSPRSWRAA